MPNESFRKREGFEQPAQVLAHDELPNAARKDFIDEFQYRLNTLRAINYLEKDLIVSRLYHDLRSIIWEVDGYEPNPNRYSRGELQHITIVLSQCSWDIFYEICEAIYSRLERNMSAHHFIEVVNNRFRYHGLAWRYSSQGEIVRVRPEHVEESIKSAWKLLSSDSRFTAASKQFVKALALTEQRPNPDYTNAVKDVIGATESVANIIGDTVGETLSDLMNRLPFKGALDPIVGGLGIS